MLERIFQVLDARRGGRLLGRSSPSSASFQELHPQGRDGRFVRKPEAAAPVQRETKGAAALKSAGVTSADAIQVLSPRVRKYQGHATVGDFVTSHPKGAAYARRVLAADHKAGRIGFVEAGSVANGRPGAPKADRDTRITVLSRSVRAYRGHATVGSFIAAHPKGELHAMRVIAADVTAGRIRLDVPGAAAAAVASRPSRWPGRAELRDTSRDEFAIVPGTVEAGLFRDEAHLRATSAALLAGVPADQPMKVVWLKRPNGAVSMVATGLKADISVSRAFTQTGKGWEVVHNTFTLPRKYQGQGGARRMLRASVEAYDDLGVSRIAVHANIDVGGYAWAKTGFSVAEESAVLTRETLARAVEARPRSHLAAALRPVLATSTDDDLMWNVARMTGPTGKPLGKVALLKSDWFGAMDLSSEKHRQRLGATFGGSDNG